MQRRAAAIYAAFFIVIAAGSYAMIGVAQEPTISIQNPDRSLSSGDQFQVNGRSYTVSKVSDGNAEFTWVDPDARSTETWKNGSTVTVDGTRFNVLTDASGEPPAVNLIEVRNLPEDVTTKEINGTVYVVLERDDDPTPELVPKEEYMAERFGIPLTRRYAVGEEFTYDNKTVTLEEVTNTSATIAWTAEQENTVSASEGANVTLNGRTFVAHFPDASTVELESNYRAYASEVHVVETYHERINGLWAVSILSALVAATLIAMAYMPSRY